MVYARLKVKQGRDGLFLAQLESLPFVATKTLAEALPEEDELVELLEELEELDVLLDDEELELELVELEEEI